MPTTRSAVLDALTGVLTQALPGIEVVVDSARPESVSRTGLVLLDGGDPGEPERLIGDPSGSWLWSHVAAIEVVVSRTKAADCSADLDRLVRQVGDALALDPTLGDHCDMVIPALADIAHEARDGAKTVSSALIRVTMEYTTQGPLGY